MAREREHDEQRPAGPGTIDRDKEEETPYAEGEVSPWYGGDTGMGDPGTSNEDAADAKP